MESCLQAPVYISSALWNLFCSGFNETRVRRIVLYCRTDGMLLRTDFTGREEELVQLFLDEVRRMGSTGAFGAKARICLASIYQLTPKDNTTHTHTHTHRERERGRGIVTNSLILSESEVAQSCTTLCNPVDTRLLRPWDPGKSTGVGCHFLLQGTSQPRDRTQVSHIVDRRFTV